jgi:hypothetical protein
LRLDVLTPFLGGDVVLVVRFEKAPVYLMQGNLVFQIKVLCGIYVWVYEIESTRERAYDFSEEYYILATD